MMEKKKNSGTIIKAILIGITIISASFVQILYLSFGLVEIVDFRCDAEVLGYKRYRTDVYE